MADCEMSCHEARHTVDLSLPVEEQRGADCFNIIGQIIELLPVFARDARRRHAARNSRPASTR
jgi:hypothetical protein